MLCSAALLAQAVAETHGPLHCHTSTEMHVHFLFIAIARIAANTQLLEMRASKRAWSRGVSERSRPWLASFLGRLLRRALRALSAAALRFSKSSRLITSPLPRSLQCCRLVAVQV